MVKFSSLCWQIQEGFMRMKALVLFLVTLAFAASAWAAATETVLYSFCAQTSCVDGEQPYGTPVADASGHLYGTTYYGGANNFGAVYELTNSNGSWTESVIYSFTGPNNGDGANPFAGLVFDKAGNLYGTTYAGGASSEGTVFELTKSGSTWTETVLHTFSDVSGNDGTNPYSALMFDAAGNLYGTAHAGGKDGYGVVFQLKPSGKKWTYKIIHVFPGANTSGGGYPYEGLVLDTKNGYLYGTAYYGGVIWDVGVVYQLREVSGVWISSVIYTFLGDSLGQYPYANLAVDGAGDLYGTTYSGGNYDLGLVFKLTPKGSSWTEKVLYSFKGYANKDGAYPYYNGLTLDASGNVYGTTYQGGSSAANNLNYGTVYELSANTYKETVLWSFGTSGDGYYPYQPPTIVKGDLYGATYVGGLHGEGTVYEVKP
jgi:uncharacterized repeat protein (TIGR03803 family)